MIVFANLLCSRREFERFMLIAGIFCLGMGAVQLGRYERYERQAAVTQELHLEIPRIGLRVAVLEGDSREHLALGAAHLTDTAVIGSPTGNAVIAGHRDLAFRGLGQLRRGDEIVIRGAHEFKYNVMRTRVVQASDTSVLADEGAPDCSP